MNDTQIQEAKFNENQKYRYVPASLQGYCTVPYITGGLGTGRLAVPHLSTPEAIAILKILEGEPNMKAKDLENTLRQCPRCATGTTYKDTCPLCYLPTITYDAWEARQHEEKEAPKTMKANQIQEIDKHICVIESTVKMLERNSVDTLVRETVFAATAKISDILAGEGREKKPDEKKPVRYFFNLQTFVVLKAGEGCLISDGDKIPAFSSDKFLEVTEADLPYLQKPAGAWEFRKYNDCDTVLEYKTWGHGDLINAACPPFVDDSNVVLRRYRWCKPAKPITKKKEKTVRYFFSLATFEIIEFTKGFIGWDTKHPLVCFADVTRDSCYFLEVTVADLPYLKKPEGDWELRTVQEEDYYLSSYFTSQGEWRKERHARIFSEGEITHMDFLQGYRWCKPLSKKEEKRVYTIDLPALEVRLLNHQAHALRKAGLLGRPIKEV